MKREIEKTLQESVDENAIIVNLRDKVLRLRIEDITKRQIDTEDVLQVDINNIIGDIITWPVLFNRISLIKAEIEDIVDEFKLNLDIEIAKKYKHYKTDLISEQEVVTSTGKRTGTMKPIFPSEGLIESSISTDEDVISLKRQLLEAKKQAKIIDGLYWAAKSKDKKLDTISAKMTPEDFNKDVLEGSINTVKIRSYQNVIK